jgi:hypothetical protein
MISMSFDIKINKSLSFLCSLLPHFFLVVFDDLLGVASLQDVLVHVGDFAVLHLHFANALLAGLFVVEPQDLGDHGLTRGLPVDLALLLQGLWLALLLFPLDLQLQLIVVALALAEGLPALGVLHGLSGDLIQMGLVVLLLLLLFRVIERLVVGLADDFVPGVVLVLVGVVGAGSLDGIHLAVFRVILLLLGSNVVVAESDVLLGLPGVVALTIALPLDEAVLAI